MTMKPFFHNERAYLLIKLLVNSRDGFEMISGNMKASVHVDNMPKMLTLLGERFSLSVKVARNFFDEYVDVGSKQTSSTDSLTQEAMEMFETDKKAFPQRLAKQKAAFQTSKTHEKAQLPNVKLIKLRAMAIMIKQKQLRNVAGL